MQEHYVGIDVSLERRVGENRTNTVGFPCPYPPFPAACPCRFPVVLADPLPSQIPPCGFPPVGSSGTIRRASPTTSLVSRLSSI